MLAPDPLETGIPADVWAMVAAALPDEVEEETPPQEALDLLEKRQQARARKDWSAADEIRRKISSLGWVVQDTPDGQKLVKS
jgi:cysteinyl-tRNA synthetase